jgi:hypothetical protein
MPINADKPHLWKSDVECSIDFYNDWFIRFAPETYRTQRGKTTESVLAAFKKTTGLTRIVPAILRETPGLLPILRMVTAPPLARDRLMGLAYVGKSLIDSMEGKDSVVPRLPKRMPEADIQANLQKICDVLVELIDDDLIPWVASKEKPSKQELDRAATVIADRMCGAASDPIIRNAQEKRQLLALKNWLKKNGYKEISTQVARDPYAMPPGTFTFRLSLPAGLKDASVKIPIDCVIKPLSHKASAFPVLIEAKSAGDATNTNKRRKEEAQKFRQLKDRYGDSVQFLLFLCGYFEPGYLGYEAAEGIDWVWEHRPNDFQTLLVPNSKKKVETVNEPSVDYVVKNNLAQEADRAEAQVEADSLKGAAERNKLGQFSTPFPLAEQMVQHALSFLGPDLSLRFLEPAVGTGVFFSALLRHVQDVRIDSATGCEIDPSYGDIAKKIWQPQGLDIITCDFIDFALDPSHFAHFSLVCANPPYVRHHHLTPERKLYLQSLVVQRLGLQPSGLSGLYVYFILLADALLTEGAIATWLLPAEFLYVNYGQVLRDYLTSKVTVLSVHHFDPDEVQFDDALVSSCIVTYRKAKPSSSAQCEMSFGGNSVDARVRRSVPITELRTLNKWTMSHFGADLLSSVGLRLKDLVTVRRGVATGANDYFIISQETIDKYEIPHVFLRPILPSPRYVHNPVIDCASDGTPLVEGFRYLLDCTASPDEVKRNYAGLWNYFEEGVAQGLPERHLCSQREAWYFQEKRAPAPFIASYMGRSRDSRSCPIRFFANFSSAIVTNVFLNLYPTAEFSEMLNNDRTRMIEFAEALNAIPSEAMLHAGRAYGGGLHKVEPKELREVPLSAIPLWLEEGLKKRRLLL